MWPSLKPSQRVGVAGVIPPQSVAAGVTVNSGWIPAANFANFMAHVSIGAITAGGSVNIAVMQAKDNAGTGAKALDAVVGLAALGETGANTSDTDYLINVRGDEFDANNGYAFLEVQVTAVADAALISGTVYGFDCKDGDASAHNASTTTTVG